MKARLGPKGLILLRHLADTGPLTPREAGGLLMPGAGEHKAQAGTGSKTDARGQANRAAGTLLGYLHRAGWVVPGHGERYHIPYSITPAGRETLEQTTRALEADPVIALGDPVPPGRKRCWRCGRARPLSSFWKSPETSDGLMNRCAPCGGEVQAERRGALIMARGGTSAAWHRASKEVIIQRAEALLLAVREARRAGTWRGRAGVRAYAALGRALDAFTRSGEDPEIVKEEILDPEDNAPPHHADPRDADWDPKRHATPARYRGTMRDSPDKEKPAWDAHAA